MGTTDKYYIPAHVVGLLWIIQCANTLEKNKLKDAFICKRCGWSSSQSRGVSVEAGSLN